MWYVAVGFTRYFTRWKLHVLFSLFFNNNNVLIFFLASGWISCLLLVVALIFSKSFISLTTNAIFSTIIHMTWSIIILWIIIASISKHRGNLNDSISIKRIQSRYVTLNDVVFYISNWQKSLVWIQGIIGQMLTSKYLLPLDKMTNCFLMVYPFITRTIILSSDSTMHLSIGLIVRKTPKKTLL